MVRSIVRVVYRQLNEARVFCKVGLGVLQGHVILSVVGELGVTSVFQRRTLRESDWVQLYDVLGVMVTLAVNA